MTILTVSQLNRQIRTYLEYEIGEVCVSGEISNLSKPASGHFYFTLKDSTAQIRCVYFRNRHATGPGSAVQNGQQVIARGKLSLYEARGDYQLIVEQLDEAGQGDLYRQFELLKVKLAGLGLFEGSRKKPLPRFPNCIGVITSATGAALHDILTTLNRRFPLIPVKIYPSDVQGKQAAPQLIQALQWANQELSCDVIILARGGGSIEDLWAFNDERLAYAIAASVIPIVSGIGHETDFTIADFVADWRAATPTAAAETVVPDCAELLARLGVLQGILKTAIRRYISHKQLLLNHAMQKITSPGRLINTHWQTLDYLQRHLYQMQKHYLAQKKLPLQMMHVRLNALHPRQLLLQKRTTIQTLIAALIQGIQITLGQHKQFFIQQLTTLHAVSPLATLERGYSITTLQGQVLMDASQIHPGTLIDVQLAKGRLLCEVRKNDANYVCNAGFDNES